MTHTGLLLLYVLMAHGCVVGVWWAAGRMMRLSHRAACHWTVAPLCFGAALTLLVFGNRFSGYAHIIVADVLLIYGFIATRRGLQWFTRKRRSDGEHQLLGLGVTLYCLGICIPMGWQVAAMVAASLVAVWVLLRALLESHAEISREFGPAAAWVLSVPTLLVALLFVARAGIAVGMPTLLMQHLRPGSVGQDLLIVGAVILTVVLNFLLGHLVVMRLVRKLQHLSQHDSLTGLLNRRAIEYLLDRETQRLQRFGQPFSVMLVDIDHFKRINDRLGHPAGDAVLMNVARVLERQAREVDWVARFGGEEFCVLLPQTLRDGALQAGERLRDAMRRNPVAWQDEFIAITISVGIASASDPTEPLLALLHRADQALYRAKAEGRDRVIMAPSYGASVTPPLPMMERLDLG